MKHTMNDVANGTRDKKKRNKKFIQIMAEVEYFAMDNV
jgi:hypothetical protein